MASSEGGKKASTGVANRPDITPYTDADSAAREKPWVCVASISISTETMGDRERPKKTYAKIYEPPHLCKMTTVT